MKTRLITLVSAVCFLLISTPTYSQDLSTTLVEEIIEDYTVDNSVNEDIDWSDQLERLTEQYEQPLNLNSASLEELERFPFITTQQAENIIAYICDHGEMKTVSELWLVEEMNKNTIDMLRPFVCVQPVNNIVHLRPSDVLKNGKHEVTARVDIPLYEQKGYKDSYLGPPLYNSVKYKFRFRNKIWFGINTEKDAGEPFGALCNKKGFDYYSAHLLIKDIRLLKTLALGDYSLKFGQGLVINTDFSMDNSSYIFSSPFISGGISKHSSNEENNFFRGIATTIHALNNFETTLFYSCRKIDGNVNNTGELTSIITTGLHRTAEEIEKKNSTTLQVCGGNMRYVHNRFQIGTTVTYYWLSRYYNPTLTGYRKYNIHGNNFYNAGVDYGYRFHRLSLLGEAALGKRGMAFINKLRYDTPNDLHLLLLHRYYAHNYWNMFANAFSRGNSVSNENGWYAAADFIPVSHCHVFASLDLYSFPWRKYRISHASQGIEGFVRTTYTFSDKLSLTGDYRLRKRDRDKSGSDGEVIYTYLQHRWRAKLSWIPTEHISTQTTMECNIFHIDNVENDLGFRITQNATFKFIHERVKLQPQVTLFYTDNYDTRVYAAESGMLYSGYSPSFYGHGVRWSLNSRYAINRHFIAHSRFTQTIYFDRSTIGSSISPIPSNIKTDIELMIECKF